jgi:hypothetical protein
MAEIVEALHRGDGILSISEMSRLSGKSFNTVGWCRAPKQRGLAQIRLSQSRIRCRH